MTDNTALIKPIAETRGLVTSAIRTLLDVLENHDTSPGAKILAALSISLLAKTAAALTRLRRELAHPRVAP